MNHKEEIEALKRQWAVGLIRMVDLPEYWVWCEAKHRCTNPNHKFWHRYGGRGISMCTEWHNDFWAFLAHIGRRPYPCGVIESTRSDLSLDRIENDQGYEPGNVKWSTDLEQRHNRSSEPVFSGENGPNRKLNWSDVREIRARVAAGETQQVLAKEFGTVPSNISQIIHEITWKDGRF